MNEKDVKTAHDFQVAAARLRPSRWIIHRCSICNYPCGYVFSPDYEKVGYDSGCDCVNYDNVQLRSWDELASIYNNQTNEEFIKEMDHFWGFKDHH